MEAFAPIPVDLFADSNAILDEDQSNYFSLSQFDLELQQQAQAALLQQDSWQDFDKYLPMDNQLFNTNNLRNQEAQPIFMNNTNSNFNSDPTLLYEPLADLLPQQQFKPIFDANATNLDNNNNVNIKQEYASPESLPYSPPQSMQPNPSLSPATNQQQNDVPLFQPTTERKSPKSAPVVTTTTPALDFTNWNSPPFDSTQAKVPIQRLKTNSIINNAVNAALNNSTPPVGRQHKKTAHNAIERRYRNNINDRIAELKNAVPALLYAKVKDSRTGKRAHRGDDDDDEGEDGEEFLDGVAVATKLNKATILRKATEYINHLKKTGEDIRRENQTLQHILSQLPGGHDVLQRYHMQKQQREKELHQQQLLERQMQKQQDQQRKLANRKRARHHPSHEHSDEYESSSSSPGSLDPVTPPAMANRVFMALFMCITFFSTSPLTTGPSSEKYQAHHHVSRTAPVPGSDTVTQDMNSPSAAPVAFLDSLFNMNDTWSTIRTIIFVVCIFQLFLPYIKSIAFGPSLKLKRVQRARRSISSSSQKETLNNVVTPGDLKNRQMYTILEKSIKSHPDDYLPSASFGLYFSLFKECARIFSRHVLGYEIMYGDQDDIAPEEEWGKVCKWIKLNETRCVGGDPYASRLSMLYSCFRMLNLVDVLDEDVHDHVIEIHTRAYATAAMQLLLVLPRCSITDKISNYFWQHAASNSKHGHNENDETEEESSLWMQSLAWTDSEQDYDSIHDMPLSRAWFEAMEILQTQNSLDVSSKGHPHLGISYTAPVVAPIAILSTLHLLDNLRIQFDRLVSTMGSGGEGRNLDHGSELAFIDIILLTKSNSLEQEDSTDQQRLAHWLAAVGAITEGLWKNKLEQAEKWLPTLIQRVPRSMSCKANTVPQKAASSQLDELIKKTMIHVLVGATLLKSSDVEKQKQGLVELENAEVLRTAIRKLQNKLRPLHENGEVSLEFTVIALAEFAVCFIGLESWINALKLEVSPEKEILIDEEVRQTTLNLRRMMRYLSSQVLTESQAIVDRLSRLGRFIAHHPGDADSACELSDQEEDEETRREEEEGQVSQENTNNHKALTRRADRAQSILRGLA
ncbi:hypothetical protein CU098_010773 [Rhizopus stolonifer]|uniref:BHLH domain-containing protein n=1 Tax=Rhizopus stolonifer TaxID=4846 RepID=A0A367KSW8_RHIST|nr:hypothetical protein CU098_010773 [Rhizopus stolonifer]